MIYMYIWTYYVLSSSAYLTFLVFKSMPQFSLSLSEQLVYLLLTPPPTGSRRSWVAKLVLLETTSETRVPSECHLLLVHRRPAATATEMKHLHRTDGAPTAWTHPTAYIAYQ